MRLRFLSIFFVGFCFSLQVNGQSNPIIKVGVFAPFYIDSAFNDNNYKLGNSISKSNLPGLEFYNGVLMAIDSLNAESIQAEVYFYDTKNSAEPLEQILQNPALKSLSIIIASFNNRTEVKTLADFALAHKIPLISETYPNDGGVVENPYFVLINSTLKTHIDALYKFVQRTYATSNLVWIKKKGQMEEIIQTYFTENNKKTPSLPLKLKTAELIDSFNTADLLNKLDSNRQNLIICGTLNEAFAMNIMKALSANPNYPSIVVGMPNWDGFRDLTKPEYKAVDVIFTSPYNFPRTDKLGLILTNKYRNKFLSRPSDYVFKGYESFLHFVKLSMKHKENLMHNLNDKSYKLFNDFDIQPLRFKKENKEPDYWENRKLYFLKKVDSQLKLLF